AAARQRFDSGPLEYAAQRRPVGRHHSFHLERWPVAHMSVESELEQRAVQTRLEAGAIAAQGSEEVAEREARVKLLAAPGEVTGGREALGDRGPSEREPDILERLGNAAAVTAHQHAAVHKTDLGEGDAVERAARRFHRLDQPRDEARP